MNRIRNENRSARQRPAGEELDSGIEDQATSPVDAAIGEQAIAEYEAALNRLVPGANITGEQSTAFNAVASNVEQQSARMRAFRSSIDKTQGALQENNNCWARIQIRTAQEYANQVADLIDTEQSLRLALHNAVAGLPRLSASAAELMAFQNTVVTSGFPAALLNRWRGAGLDEAGIEVLRYLVAHRLVDLSTQAGTYRFDAIREPFSSADFAGADAWRSFAMRPVADAYPCQPFTFSGFFAPVDNPPGINRVIAGAAVPVRFGLGGNRGLDILVTVPTSGAVDCSSLSPVGAAEETRTAGGSTLTYDASSASYKYVWQTNREWAGTCRRLTMQLIDGSSHEAIFQFTK